MKFSYGLREMEMIKKEIHGYRLFTDACIPSNNPPKPYVNTCESSNSPCACNSVYRRRTMANHGFLGEDYLPSSWRAFSSRRASRKRIIYIVDPPNLKRQKLVHKSITNGDHHHKNHNKVSPVKQSRRIIPPKLEQRLKRQKLVHKSITDGDHQKKVSPMMKSQIIHPKLEQTPKKKKITQKKKHMKQTKEKTKITYFGPTPPPDLATKYRHYIEGIGGTDIHLVIQKPLYDSDLKKHLSRLSVPVSKFNEKLIFTEKERSNLRTKVGETWYSLVVPVIDKDLEISDISVKRWNMEKKNGSINNPMYVLTTTWNNLAAKNHLESGDIIQVWSFRVKSSLHLVLILVEKKPAQGITAAAQ